MPTAAWISCIVAIATFVITHIVVTVWWASRVNTLLDIVQKNLGELVSELKTVKTSFVTKEEAARELAIAEKETRAIWKKLDAIANLCVKNHGEISLG